MKAYFEKTCFPIQYFVSIHIKGLTIITPIYQYIPFLSHERGNVFMAIVVELAERNIVDSVVDVVPH
jgi:hypothetical protein